MRSEEEIKRTLSLLEELELKTDEIWGMIKALRWALEEEG